MVPFLEEFNNWVQIFGLKTRKEVDGVSQNPTYHKIYRFFLRENKQIKTEVLQKSLLFFLHKSCKFSRQCYGIST